MNTNYQMNPYQQNVDILKGFFKRPIILVSAILLGVLSILSLISNSLDKTQTTALKVDFKMFGSSLPATTILACIGFFLFYFFSRNSKSLKAPTTLFKVASVLELVGICVLVGVLLVVFILLLILANNYESLASTNPELYRQLSSFYALFSYYLSSSPEFAGDYSSTLTMSVINVVFATLIVCIAIGGGIAIWFYSAKVKYACAIKKSTKSINLYKNGAGVYGVLSIIFGGIMAISALGSIGAISKMTSPLSVISLICIAASSIIDGIIAIQYGKYIKNISANFATQPAYGNAPYGSVNPASFTEQPAQTPYGNPYTEPVQPVNPAPVYQPYEPQPVVPAEDAPVYEAPVQEEVTEEVTAEPVADVPVEEAPAETSAPKFCSACGNAVNPDDYFCNNCGNKLK